MADIFTIDTLRSLDSELANSNIKGGEPAVRSANGVDPFDPANDTTVDAIVAHQRASDANSRYEFEYGTYDDLYTYKPAGNKSDEDFDDRVPLYPLTEKDVVRFMGIEDTTATEPTYDENDEVGFADIGNGPRLVPAGYTTGGTQYGNGGAGDYVAIGRVDKLPRHKDKRKGYNELIPVRITQNV